jgi:hypothetical protein
MSKIYVLMSQEGRPVSAYSTADLAARSAGCLLVEEGASSPMCYRVVALDLLVEPVSSTFENAVTSDTVTVAPKRSKAAQ